MISNDRPTRSQSLMAMALEVSKRSTCSRLAVGAIISREGRPLSTGYNGTAAGLPHCNHDANTYPCDNAVHAEANAISFAARWGVATNGAELHVTHAPCLQCAKLIINAGIMCVTWLIPYRLTDGLDLLESANVRWVMQVEGK